jgi:hypothetical protein
MRRRQPRPRYIVNRYTRRLPDKGVVRTFTDWSDGDLTWDERPLLRAISGGGDTDGQRALLASVPNGANQ